MGCASTGLRLYSQFQYSKMANDYITIGQLKYFKNIELGMGGFSRVYKGEFNGMEAAKVVQK